MDGCCGGVSASQEMLNLGCGPSDSGKLEEVTEKFAMLLTVDLIILYYTLMVKIMGDIMCMYMYRLSRHTLFSVLNSVANGTEKTLKK